MKLVRRRAVCSTWTRQLALAIAVSAGTIVVPAPGALAHKDPETGAAIETTANASFSTPAALDGKSYVNPGFRVVLLDHSPRTYSYNGGRTSTTAQLELDLALSPSGPCPSNPSGYVDIQTRDLDSALTPVSPWRTTNSFTKSFPCSYASRGETWHYGRDGMGFVTQGARNFEVRLVDRNSGAVYLTAVGPGSYVTPKPPTALKATPGVDGTVSLQWQDNSQWENHMELQRAGEFGTPWTTIARPDNAGVIYGTVSYLDRVPFSPSNLYRYRVRAVSGDRASAWSSIVATSAPSSPASFRTTDVARTSVALAWGDAYGESSYELQRSADDFATIERSWELQAGTTSHLDAATESLTTYDYRIRSVHEAGASGWSSLEVRTRGLYEPVVPGFEEAAAACPSDGMTVDWIGSCVLQRMYEYDVHVYEVNICAVDDSGLVQTCSKLILYTLLASERPHLPDDDDPGVPPPPAGPGEEKWVPPHAPGEDPWEWGGNTEAGFPTREGSWSRPCGNSESEYLHWGGPHDPPKPDHWMFKDCSGNIWEMPFEWLQYGRVWHPANPGDPVWW